MGHAGPLGQPARPSRRPAGPSASRGPGLAPLARGPFPLKGVALHPEAPAYLPLHLQHPQGHSAGRAGPPSLPGRASTASRCLVTINKTCEPCPRESVCDLVCQATLRIPIFVAFVPIEYSPPPATSHRSCSNGTGRSVLLSRSLMGSVCLNLSKQCHLYPFALFPQRVTCCVRSGWAQHEASPSCPVSGRFREHLSQLPTRSRWNAFYISNKIRLSPHHPHTIP